MHIFISHFLATLPLGLMLRIMLFTVTGLPVDRYEEVRRLRAVHDHGQQSHYIRHRHRHHGRPPGVRGQCAGDDHEEDAGRDEVVESVDGRSAGGGTRNLAEMGNWKLEEYFFFHNPII